MKVRHVSLYSIRSQDETLYKTHNDGLKKKAFNENFISLIAPCLQESETTRVAYLNKPKFN